MRSKLLFYVILIFIISAFAWFGVKAFDAYRDYTAAKQLGKSISAIAQNSKIISAVGNETYYSMLYAGRSGANYLDQMKQARSISDAELAKLAELSATSQKNTLLQNLKYARANIDALGEEPLGVLIDYYKKEVILPLLGLYGKFSAGLDAADLRGEMTALKNISKEAANLAKALQGKKQMQGSWGEMILDSVLEYSGLLKGEHYEKQPSYRDDSHRLRRPDVIVKLPGGRSIAIDSKVSLNSYNAYIQAQSDEERKIRAAELVKAFRRHIDELSSRDYASYSSKTLQHVFMFVPIEGAFALAVQSDDRLYEYALGRHIAVVTPSTLTVSLRTVYLYWQSEQSGVMAARLFAEAGKLYDKIVIFGETFHKVGEQMQTLQKSYDKAYRQLAQGSGNILKKSAKLKELGARTTKSLKQSKIEYDDIDDEDMDIKIISNKQK